MWGNEWNAPRFEGVNMQGVWRARGVISIARARYRYTFGATRVFLPVPVSSLLSKKCVVKIRYVYICIQAPLSSSVLEPPPSVKFNFSVYVFCFSCSLRRSQPTGRIDFATREWKGYGLEHPVRGIKSCRLYIARVTSAIASIRSAGRVSGSVSRTIASEGISNRAQARYVSSAFARFLRDFIQLETIVDTRSCFVFRV